MEKLLLLDYIRKQKKFIKLSTSKLVITQFSNGN